MDLYKIPVLMLLAVSMGMCSWLMFRPSMAQRYFADRLEKQDQPFTVDIARRLGSVPVWGVRVWGLIALGLEIFTAWAIIFLVD